MSPASYDWVPLHKISPSTAIPAAAGFFLIKTAVDQGNQLVEAAARFTLP